MNLGNPADSLQLFGCVYCLQTFTSKDDLFKHKNENHYEREHPATKQRPRLNKRSGKAQAPKIKFIKPIQKQAADDKLAIRSPRRNQIVQKTKGLSERKKVVCLTCSKILWSRTAYDDHQRLHTGDRPFPCSKCKRRFYSRKALLQHRIPDSSGGSFSCRGTRSQTVIRKAKRLVTSRRDVHEKPKGRSNRKKVKLVCPICSKALWSRVAYNDHQRLHTGDRPFPCSKCNLRFYSHKALYKHRVPDTQGGFSCRIPILRNSNYLDTSQNIGLEKKTNGPPVRISKSTVQSGRLIPPAQAISSNSLLIAADMLKQPSAVDTQSQSRSVLKVEPPTPTSGKGIGKQWHLCSMCGKTLRTSTTLKYHIMRYHAEAPQPQFRPRFTSSAIIAKAKIRHPTNFKREQETMTSRIRCPYPYCTRFFKKKEYLREHLRIHTGEKPVKCSGCGERFRTTANRWFHRKAGCPGSESKPEISQDVGRPKTTQTMKPNRPRPSSAALSKESENNVKHAKCGFCDKTILKVHLEDHVRGQHTGEKPFECNVCKTAYSSLGSLWKHRRPGKCTGRVLMDIKSNTTVLEKPKVRAVQPKIADYFKPKNLSPQIESEPITIKTPSATYKKEILNCPHCPRKLTCSRNLIEHIRIHTGELPFQCSGCNRKFRTQRTFTDHQRWSCEMETKDATHVRKAVSKLKQNSQPDPQPSRRNRAAKKTEATKVSEPLQKKECPCPFCVSMCSNSADLLEHIRKTHVEI